MTVPRRAMACGALGLAGLLLSTFAEAGPPRAGQEVERTLEQVERKVRQGGSRPAAAAEPLGKARKALERARGARDAGDVRHAPLLEQLAAEWAAVAVTTVRAFTAEAEAATLARRARDLRKKLDRSRALLAEQQARRGRLQAEVRKAEQKAEQRRRGAVEAEQRRLDKAERRRSSRKPRKQPPANPGGGR